VQTLNESDMQTHAVIDERCEKCGREQVRFYTQQLRSADEGTTVFYECECGNKYVPVDILIDHLLTKMPCRWNTNN
jgi:DNA-directed RNA polymerase I subunit RPA12